MYLETSLYLLGYSMRAPITACSIEVSFGSSLEIISPEIPRLLKDYGFKSNSCWYLFMVVLISLDVILTLLFVTPPILSRKCCKRLL
jgi:hypothetical protein